jgi:hypothetical protein
VQSCGPWPARGARRSPGSCPDALARADGRAPGGGPEWRGRLTCESMLMNSGTRRRAGRRLMATTGRLGLTTLEPGCCNDRSVEMQT